MNLNLDFDDKISLPQKYYSFLFLFAVVAGIVALFLPEGIIQRICSNVSYGVFCSTLVALLVDYGSTQKKIINDKASFTYFTMGIKSAFEFLIVFRVQYEKDFKINNDETKFYDWFMKLMYDEEKHPPSIIYNLGIFCLQYIQYAARMLRRQAGAFTNNLYVTEEFLHNLDLLIDSLSYLKKKRDRLDIDRVYGIGSLFKTILIINDLFPEYGFIFLTEWNHLEMAKKYDKYGDSSLIHLCHVFNSDFYDLDGRLF